MKRDTRNEIINTARALFNERGFNAVSTRDIAEKMGISKGNLTYHFNKKEEIVEAILAQNTDNRPKKAPENLMELDAYFLNMQRAVQENSFYFWHHAQLGQVSETIRQRQKDRYQDNTAMLKLSFFLLKAEDILRDEHFTGEYDRVIDSLILFSIYWMPFQALKQDADITYKHQAWTSVYHLLTEKGREELKNIISV